MGAKLYHMGLYGWALNLYESYWMWGALPFSFSPFGQGLGYGRQARK